MRKARRGAEQSAPYSNEAFQNEIPAYPPPYGYSSPMMNPNPNPYDPNAATQGMYPGPAMGAPYYAPPAGNVPTGEQYNFSMPSQIFQNPAVANMAMQYGQTLVGQGKEVIDRELNKYVSMSRIKYYFSVDTAYVMKKLGLILFPFSHKDWSVKYNPEEPVQPRFELNAPDLYIPVMAFVTYVLVGGVSLGVQKRFTPEELGIQASSALVWALIEVFAIWLTLYVMNIHSNLKTLDILAFSSYKYVGMIVALLASLANPGFYHLALLYVSISLMYFLVRTLKVQVLPGSSGDNYGNSNAGGSKRRTYLLLFIAGLQPLLSWWLTRHLVPAASS
nr:EOG090X0ATU [Eulimnadia texana]